MSEAAIKKPTRLVQLRPMRMTLSEYAHNRYTIVAEPGTDYERFLEPDYLAHVAAKLAPWDELTVRAEDGSWMAKLVVRNAENGSVKVAEMAKYEFKPMAPALVPTAEGFEVVWKGPGVKFRIVRKSDNGTIREGFPDRETANAWLADNLKSLAAA